MLTQYHTEHAHPLSCDNTNNHWLAKECLKWHWGYQETVSDWLRCLVSCGQTGCTLPRLHHTCLPSHLQIYCTSPVFGSHSGFPSATLLNLMPHWLVSELKAHTSNTSYISSVILINLTLLYIVSAVEGLCCPLEVIPTGSCAGAACAMISSLGWRLFTVPYNNITVEVSTQLPWQYWAAGDCSLVPWQPFISSATLLGQIHLLIFHFSLIS